MSRDRSYSLASAVAVVWLALSGGAEASQMMEPNNTAASAAILAPGRLLIVDELDASVRRPDPMLALSDALFQTFTTVNDDTPGVGDGRGSQLLNMPLSSKGTAYFRVTGHGDNAFQGAHSEDGSYEVTYVVYDSAHNVVGAPITKIEDIKGGAVDNLFLRASEGSPNGFVDVTINNLPFPPTGDPVDFFYFEGLAANKPFEVKITQAAFAPLLGIFNKDYQLVSSASGPNPVLTGTADEFGRALIGITGAGDSLFVGAHTDVGQYTVEITPEPGTGVLLAVGAAMFAIWGRYVRRRRA